MDTNSIIGYLKQAGATLYDLAVNTLTALAPLRSLIEERFGQPGVIAAYVAMAVIGFLIAWRLLKITFAAIKYLVLPAVALALLASWCLPYSFAVALPFTVTLCSLVLLAKG